MLDFSTMNEPQRQAVTHGEGPLLLLAGPGSGKTFTITNRILYLINQGISPAEILVITFTKEAAMSMQGRFQKMCGEHSYSVNFGTFHSVFYHILRESNCLASVKVLTQSDKKNLLLPILNQYEESRDGQQYLNDDALKILSSFSYYKNTLALTETVNKMPEQWQSHFEELFHAYEKEVKKTGQVDFDDMVYKCMKLLQSNIAVREYWQKRFVHILVDEFQDINPIQYETLKLLSKSPHNLFAVGDDDQSIYGFRGSQPECLKRFLEEYHARQLLLDLNYRSVPEIVDASLKVIGENKNRFAKSLKSAVSKETGENNAEEKNAGEKNAGENNTGENNAEENNTGSNVSDNLQTTVVLKSFIDKQAQTEYLIESLKQELERNAENTCAVLFRTNQMMQSVCVALCKAEIPYKMREKSSNVYEHFVVQDIVAYLKLAKGVGNRADFLSIMNKPSRYLRRDMVVFDKSGLNVEKTKENYRISGVPEREKISAMDRLQIFEKQLTAISKMSLVPAISYICKAVGYERFLKEEAGGGLEKTEEWQEIISWLKTDAADYDSLEEWLEFQKEYAGESKSKKEEMKNTKAEVKNTNAVGSVELLTAHASKGLEFDKVWIPDCNERVFPYGRMPDEKAVEEERRIFYVAMTRAKKCLELLYLTGTKERPRQPSAFLNSLF